MKRALFLVTVLSVLFCSVCFTYVWAIETVADLDDLETIVDAAWTNNSQAKIIPPGDYEYRNSLGVFAYDADFPTNFLVALVAVTNANGTNTFLTYPVEVIELTNASIPVYSDGTNTNSLLTIYSNDIAFVQIESDSEGVDLYLHAPTNVPTLDLFKSTNLLETYGWTLPATLDHVIDPILWTYTRSDSPAFFSGGNASVDADSDGLADARELRMFGTITNLFDTDGDGLGDLPSLLDLPEQAWVMQEMRRNRR